MQKNLQSGTFQIVLWIGTVQGEQMVDLIKCRGIVAAGNKF